MKNVFIFLKNYIKNYKFSFGIYLGLCFLYSVLSLLSPYVSGNFIDALLKMETYKPLVRYCILFGSISIVIVVINYTVNQLFTHLRINISYKINMKLLNHMRKVSILYMQKYTAVSVTQKINYDSNSITTFGLQTAQNILINIMTLTLPLGALFRFNVKIGIILMLLIAVYLVTYIGFRKPLYAYSKDTREKETIYFNELYNQFGYMKFIKTNVVQHLFDALLHDTYIKLLRSSMNTQKIAYIFASLDKIIMMIAQIALFGIGGIQVINGELTIGRFTIISTYFNMIMGSVRYFFGLGKTVQEIQVSLKRLCDLLDIPEEKYGVQTADAINMLEIKLLNFHIGGKDIITNFTAKFEKGNIYSIIGRNGSGKSTLVNILTGMYWLPGEKIYLNQSPLQQYDLNQIRHDKMGVLEQEPVLIEDTMKKNIFLEGDDLSKSEKFQMLCKILNIDTFFEKLPNGLNTIVNEKAMNISGGEKQKIALLRVLMKDADILVLDEPTSAMDINSREEFYSYLNNIKKEKIIILVNHDREIKDKVDYIIDLSGNKKNF